MRITKSQIRISGLKKRTTKQIARAGKTLSMGMIALPFIPFENAIMDNTNFKSLKGGNTK